MSATPPTSSGSRSRCSVLELNPIGIAVPFFFGLMVIEWAYARRTGRSLYRLNDAIAALVCGMGDQLLGLLSGVVTVAAYAWVQSRWSLFTWDIASPWTWCVGILLVDLLYYAYHRFSHRVNFAWATHAVHHQSEDYNLAVALRQSWFTKTYSWVFYLPLAVLGLPAAVWLGAYALNLIYQYWIHTQAIERLGPLEWILNTPSHHRVHHGTNPQYIDKNYAGILIIWDRLFGTFEPEHEPVSYGVLKPIRTWNPLVANVMPFVTLARDSAAQERGIDKVWMWFAAPGWSGSGASLSETDSSARGYDLNAAPGLTAYILVHLLPVGTATAFVIAYSSIAPPSQLMVGAGYIFWTGMNWAGLIEGRAWSEPSEWTRLVSVAIAGAFVPPALGWPLVALSLVSLPWFYRGRQ